MESNDIIKALDGAILNAKKYDCKVWSIEVYKLEKLSTSSPANRQRLKG